MLQIQLSKTLLLLAIVTLSELHAMEPTQKNIVYGMDHGSALLMDAYIPPSQNGAAVVFIMGTGFTAHGGYDDIPLKDLDLWLLENQVFPNLYGETEQMFGPLLERGFTVFSINHRLGPKNVFETQLADCQRAVQFIRYSSGRYGIDGNWIASMGHSSGATLATFLGVVDDCKDPASLDPVARLSSKPQAVIAAAGVHDLLLALQDTPQVASILASFTGRVISHQPDGHPVFEAYQQASTISHVTERDPPVFIIHGESDSAVRPNQSARLKESLDAAAVSSVLLILPGASHAALGEAVDPLPFDQAADWLESEYRKARD